ncbi:universal stress protein [Streptomyces sp. NPDC088789]|uniref:universal stress protein n=1 Tax=Streptomyces sp. NPDC088789 TaxID=3365899 RepID=UPI0037F8EFA9
MNSHNRGSGRVVVGVDGSGPSKDALRWAVRHAELTGAEVDAVIAWQVPAYLGSLGWMPPPSDFAPQDLSARILADAVSEVVSGPEPVRIRQRTEQGTAPDVLLRAARGADLLVVGSRGHGGFTGALLGSVGQHCTQHATCPVLVVRGPGLANDGPDAPRSDDADGTR